KNFAFAADAAVANSGTFRLQGGETLVSVTSLGTAAGTIEYTGANAAAAQTFTLFDFGATDYFNLNINAANGTDTFQVDATKDLPANGPLTVAAGTYDANGRTTSAAATSVSGGTYNAGAGTQNVGDLSVSGGTFTGGAGAVNAGKVTLTKGTLTAP